MNIGKLTRKQLESGRYSFRGSIRTLRHSLRLQIDANPNKKAGVDDSPDFVVFAVAADGELIECGLAWLKTVKHGEGKGRQFLSLLLDDESMTTPLNVAAFPASSDGLTWDVVWNRPRGGAAQSAEAA